MLYQCAVQFKKSNPKLLFAFGISALAGNNVSRVCFLCVMKVSSVWGIKTCKWCKGKLISSTNNIRNEKLEKVVLTDVHLCEEVQALTENSHKTKYLHSELAWFWFFLFIFLFFYCPFRACLKPFSPQTGSGFYTDGLFNVRASKRGKCRIFKHCLGKSSRPGSLCCLLKNKSYLYTILTTLL